MKQVFVVFKNSDMTEGRGPMVIDSIFESYEKACDYMNTKDGVMGRSGTYNNTVTGHIGEGWQDKQSWPYGGDWQVKTYEVK